VDHPDPLALRTSDTTPAMNPTGTARPTKPKTSSIVAPIAKSEESPTFSVAGRAGPLP